MLKRLHYPLEVMLVCARWYAAYPLSLRHIEEMMHERGVFVDHATVHRWALNVLPIFTTTNSVMILKGNTAIAKLIVSTHTNLWRVRTIQTK